MLGEREAPYADPGRPRLLLGGREAPLVPCVGFVGIGLRQPLLDQRLVEHIPAQVDVGQEPAVLVLPLDVELEPHALAGEGVGGESGGLGPRGSTSSEGSFVSGVSMPIRRTSPLPSTAGEISMVSPSTTRLTLAVASWSPTALADALTEAEALAVLDEGGTGSGSGFGAGFLSRFLGPGSSGSAFFSCGAGSASWLPDSASSGRSFLGSDFSTFCFSPAPSVWASSGAQPPSIIPTASTSTKRKRGTKSFRCSVQANARQEPYKTPATPDGRVTGV